MKSYGQPDFKRTMDRIFMTKSGKAAIVDHITENKAYRYSYGRLKTMINEVGEILKSAGIAPTERIAVLTKPSAKTAIMLLALSYLGYTAVIPDTSLPAEEQERLLDDISERFDDHFAEMQHEFIRENYWRSKIAKGKKHEGVPDVL